MELFPNFWAAIGSAQGMALLTLINLVIAGWSARSAARAQLRPKPIVQVIRKVDSPWQGWAAIDLHISNPSLFWIEVESVHVPRLVKGNILPSSEATIPSEQVNHSWVTGKTLIKRSSARHTTAPALSGARAIAADISVRAGGAPQRIRVLAPPVDGRLCCPSRLHIAYRYHDQRSRLRVVKTPIF